jgi:hypothetical protein
MAKVKVTVKRSVRLRGPNLDNGVLTKIGEVMVSTIKARIAQGLDADGNKALPLSRSYAIFKAGYLKKNRGIGTNRPIRDLSLSGASLQNYTLRRAADNVIRADATTRMARLKLTQGQQQQRKRKGVTSTLGTSQMFGWEGRNVADVLAETRKQYGDLVKKAVIPIG